MPTVSVHTLGCKLNYAESGTILRDFEHRSYRSVAAGQPADVTVINTCSVTEEADRKCRQIIRRSLRANPDSFVVVTGCYAQLQPGDIARIPGVDAVLGTGEKLALFDYISSFSKREKTQIDVSCIDDVSTFGSAYAIGERTRAFLKIQDGCDYTCAFCTIPRARGRSRSSRIEHVLTEARDIARAGYREIVISGVNIGLFGQDTDESFVGLLKALDRIEGIDRYRISSIEPNLLTDEIIDFVAGSDHFMPHFHVPLQSGDDEILGRMRRRYQREIYASRVSSIRSAIPDACIGVDVITGFPTETGEHFDNTVRFIEDLPVSYLHAFTYSERPDTVAADELSLDSSDVVDRAERSRRTRVLRLLSARKKQAFCTSHLGTVRPVLWESESKVEIGSTVESGSAVENGSEGRVILGFTDNYIRVEMPLTRGGTYSGASSRGAVSPDAHSPDAPSPDAPSQAGAIQEVRLVEVGNQGRVRVESDEYISILG